MYSIGDFSKKANLTVRAIRYYEEKGILKPENVDEHSGYRYYSDSQIDDAKLITILKDVGFSIKDIQSIIFNEANPNYLYDQLVLRKDRAIEEVNEAKYRLSLILSILNKYIEFDYNKNLLEVLKMDVLRKDVVSYQKSFFEMANEQTRKALKNNIDMAGIVIDIDNFKKINDQYGFDIGDIVLREIKNVILSVNCVDDDEFVVERHGGDEFRILYKGSLENAYNLAEKIRVKISEIDYSMYCDNLLTTSTIGVAKLIKDSGAATMFANATSAMFLGKQSGGNNTTIYDL